MIQGDMMDIDDQDEINEKYFRNLSSRERAIFEGAISMGALFHQFVGTPVSLESLNSLERAIESSIKLQPGIKKVKVAINPGLLRERDNEFDYVSLSGDMLDVEIHSQFKQSKAIIRMKFLEDLNYPLMYVESIS